MSVKSEGDGKMSRQEAGRKGGEKVARERGSEFYRRIGKKGGKKVAEERGSEFFKELEGKAAKAGKTKLGVTPSKGSIDRKPETSIQR
jgi:general stress protein YciG